MGEQRQALEACAQVRTKRSAGCLLLHGDLEARDRALRRHRLLQGIGDRPWGADKVRGNRARYCQEGLGGVGRRHLLHQRVRSSERVGRIKRQVLIAQTDEDVDLEQLRDQQWPGPADGEALVNVSCLKQAVVAALEDTRVCRRNTLLIGRSNRRRGARCQHQQPSSSRHHPPSHASNHARLRGFEYAENLAHYSIQLIASMHGVQSTLSRAIMCAAPPSPGRGR